MQTHPTDAISNVDETLLSMLRDLCLADNAPNSLLDIIELLVQHRHAMSTHHDVVLRWSARKGHLHIVRLLVDNGFVDIHDHDDYALRHAARKGHLHVVRYLLDVGADVHAEDDYALRVSAINGHVNVVRLLQQAMRKTVRPNVIARGAEIGDNVEEDTVSTPCDEVPIERRSSRARRPSARHRMSIATVRLPPALTSGVKKNRIHQMVSKRTSAAM